MNQDPQRPQRHFSPSEERVLLRAQAEQLRLEAIRQTGDPQARSSQALQSPVRALLPDGEQAAGGQAVTADVVATHFDRAEDDPQKPKAESNRKQRQKTEQTTNVNLQQKAEADTQP